MSPALNVAKRTTTLPHFELDQYDCAIPCVVPRTFVPLLSVKVPHPRGETTLANLSGIVKQLKRERDRVQHQLSGVNAALAAFANVYSTGTKPRRKLSARGRARIAAAQRARWARVKGRQNVIPIAKSGKRTMSASARRKIAAAQRKRWAKFRAEKAA